MNTKLILNVCDMNFDDSAHIICANVKFPANVTSTEPALWGGLQTHPYTQCQLNILIRVQDLVVGLRIPPYLATLLRCGRNGR